MRNAVRRAVDRPAIPPMHAMQHGPIGHGALAADHGRERMCGGEAGEGHGEAALPRERQSGREQRAEGDGIVVLDGDVRQVDLPQRRADGRQRRHRGERGREIDQVARAREPRGIAAHERLFHRALVPDREAGAHAGAASDDQEILDPQAADGEESLQVVTVPDRRELAMAIVTLEKHGDGGDVGCGRLLDAALRSAGGGADREGGDLAGRRIGREAGESRAQQAACFGVVGCDRGQREEEVVRIMQQGAHGGEAASEHLDAVAMRRRDPQRPEIGQAADLAIHECLAHGPLADADGFAGGAIARDDEGV